MSKQRHDIAVQKRAHNKERDTPRKTRPTSRYLNWCRTRGHRPECQCAYTVAAEGNLSPDSSAAHTTERKAA